MKKIIIYSGNSCTNCTAAKEYIKEKGYDYEEKNVSLDQEAKKELIGMGYIDVYKRQGFFTIRCKQGFNANPV